METRVLLKTARWGELAEERYGRLSRDLRRLGGHRVAALVDGGEAPAGVEAVVFRREDLLSLVRDGEYCPRSSGGWRNAPLAAAMSLLPLLLYARDHPADRYWQVEDDVYMRGDWADFFGAFSDSGADLVATRVLDDRRAMSWVADTVRMERAFAGGPPLRQSLNCVCGVSRRLVESLLAGYAEGMYGHFEAVVATRCAQAFGDGSLEDISWGRYCRPENLRRFYWPDRDRTDADGRFEWCGRRKGQRGVYAEGKLYHAEKKTIEEEAQAISNVRYETLHD